MPEDKVRVLRILEYEGPRAWVEDVVARSINGTKRFDRDKVIRAATIGAYPEILAAATAAEAEGDNNG